MPFPPGFVSLATLRVVFHVTQIVCAYSRIRDPVFSGESVTEPPNLRDTKWPSSEKWKRLAGEVADFMVRIARL